MASTKACVVEEDRLVDPTQRTKKIEILAHQKWESATGGNPVDDEASRQFWLEAEMEVDGGKTPSS